MPTYVYKAMNKKGQESTGEIVADNSDMAIKEIQKKDLFPTEVKEKREKGFKRATTTAIVKVRKSMGIGAIGGGVPSKTLANFTRQLSTLQDAGLPLVRSLQILANQEPNKIMCGAVETIVADIQGGSNLSEAMRKHPKIFDRLYVNMVRAGEAGGVLDVILNRLTEFMEKAEALKRKVKGALTYPVTVMGFAIVMVTFIMMFVIPKFEKMFETIEGDLPLPTQILRNMSHFIAGGGWIVILLLPVFIFVGFKILKSHETGRIFWDKVVMRIPMVGLIVKKSTVSRFCRTLGTLQASGVPLLEALAIVKDAAGNAVIEVAINDVHDSVKEGDSIAEPLGTSGLFEPMVVNMVEVGEETGELDKMLMKVADNYDSDVDALVSGLTAAFEPILIVVLGVLIGGIVIALFLPMIKMMESLS
jgi:type IV pilus assembly protein PilC